MLREYTSITKATYTNLSLNIAEGAGEFARKEKARFYRMARRSATECAAILDVVGELRLADERLLRDGRTQLQTIVAMLIGLVKHMDREPSAGKGEA